MQKKIIGLIGGIAPPSTVEYYHKIIKGYQEKTRTSQYPSILINSINMTKMLDFVFRKEFDGLVDYLGAEIKKLMDGGAEFAALASNTPHIVFDRLQEKTKIPLISIVEATVRHAKRRGLKKLGLFGLKSTMQDGFYQAGFAKEDIDIVIPSKESQEYIHSKYLSELVKGIFLPDTKKALIEIVNGMIGRENIDGLILGGTELPLILQEKDFKNLELLNTTEIHVESILDYALKN
jgi:aspartate racemase